MPSPNGPELNQAMIEDLIGYNLRRASHVMIRDFFNAMDGCDIAPAQYAVLALIMANPARKQAEIGAALGIKRANFIALFDSLEVRGFVRREASQIDRRSLCLFVTPLGEQLMRDVNARVARHEEKFSALMSPDELNLFLTILKRIWNEPHEGDSA